MLPSLLIREIRLAGSLRLDAATPRTWSTCAVHDGPASARQSLPPSLPASSRREIVPAMSSTTRVLLGLLAGLLLGIALASWLPASWQPLAAWIEPIGTLWTRALQLIVIPLVTTLLFTGVSAGGAGLGRL